MSILFQKVIGRWFNEWEQRLQMNVSKIVWSAKDQAKVIEAVKKKKAEQKNMRYLAYVGESKVLVPCGHIVPVDATDIKHRLCPICKALSYHSLKSNFPYDPLLPTS